MRLSAASLWAGSMAGLLLGAVSIHAASTNDPAVLGAWKGTGADAKWVINFLPNDVYQLRLGDSPTGSRGVYVAGNGKIQLLEGNQKQKVLSGTYRVEDCKVLTLVADQGTVRLNRSGTPPTGSCGQKSAADPGNSVFGTAVARQPAASPPAGTSPGSNRSTVPQARMPDSGSAQRAPSTARATATGKKVAGAAAEAGTAVKSGAATLWDKTKSVTHKAVAVGGKAAKTVGHKAQEAGRAVANTVRKAGDDAEAEPKPNP